jgi:hypothetical protein
MTPNEAIEKLDLIVRCLRRAPAVDAVRTALKAAEELQTETQAQYASRPTGGEWKKEVEKVAEPVATGFEKTGDAEPVTEVVETKNEENKE